MVVHDPSKSIDKIADVIGDDLKRITDEIITNKHNIKQAEAREERAEDFYDDLYDKFENMEKKVNDILHEVKILRKQASKNSKEIQILLNNKFAPIGMMRASSTDTIPYSSGGEFKTKF